MTMFNAIWEVIHVNDEQQGSKDRVLWHTTSNRPKEDAKPLILQHCLRSER